MARGELPFMDEIFVEPAPEPTDHDDFWDEILAEELLIEHVTLNDTKIYRDEEYEY